MRLPAAIRDPARRLSLTQQVALMSLVPIVAAIRKWGARHLDGDGVESDVVSIAAE